MSQLAPLLFVCLGPAEHTHTAEELESAIADAAVEDRSVAIDQLEAAIAEHYQRPDVAGAELPAELLQAYVVLARLYIAEGDEASAREVIDELIRGARGQVPPVRSYGPEVSTLYRERKRALAEAGTALLEFECEVECEVVVNGRRSSGASETLLLGEYGLWIRAKGDPPGRWEFHSLELREAGGHQRLHFEDPNPSPDPPLPPRPLEAPAQHRRMLPRGVEIGGAVVGLGLVIAGAIVRSFDGRCSNYRIDARPGISPEICGDVYVSKARAAALFGVGAGVLSTFGVLLGVDEHRAGGARARRITVGVSFKF